MLHPVLLLQERCHRRSTISQGLSETALHSAHGAGDAVVGAGVHAGPSRPRDGNLDQGRQPASIAGTPAAGRGDPPGDDRAGGSAGVGFGGFQEEENLDKSSHLIIIVYIKRDMRFPTVINKESNHEIHSRKRLRMHEAQQR